MVLLVHDRYGEGHGLLAIHGGLVLLAIPFQLTLVVVPLLMMLLLPSEWMYHNRLLEWALVCYLFILTIAMRVFPYYARRFVAFAAFTRRWLISMTRLSWMAPILVLWLLGRLASIVVVTWIGPDLAVSIAAEKAVFEDWLGIGSIPENSFLDLLTALAVMPLAAFTTFGVLAGGSGALPQWMKLDKHEDWESPESEEEEVIEEAELVVEEPLTEDDGKGIISGLLEDVIPVGAAAIMPMVGGITLSDSIDGADEGDSPMGIFDKL